MSFSPADRLQLARIASLQQQVIDGLRIKEQLDRIESTSQQILDELNAGNTVGQELTQIAAEAKAGLDSISSEVKPQ
jgi:hypothetical protein